jgi:hypothetical protein
MKQFFDKFKGLEEEKQESLDDKLKIQREPVSVLNVSKYDWVNWHLTSALERIGFPTELVTIIQNKDRFAENHFDIIYGMHQHDNGVTSFDEIGAFRGLGDFLIYSDCCHGKQGPNSGANTWVCDDYAIMYLAWAVKDISEGTEEYLELGREYNRIVELALKNKDLERAKVFAKISRFEINDVDYNIDYYPKKDGQIELAEILLKSGNKDVIIEHYEHITSQANQTIKDIEKYPKNSDSSKRNTNERFGISEHIELFERYNQQLEITGQEFDINELKNSYEALK